MKNNINKDITTITIGIISIYLVIAFVLNKIDFTLWQQDERLICASLWFLFISFWALISKYPDVG